MKKLYVKVYGCQMSEYDAKKTADVLMQDGNITAVNLAQSADIIVLITCSIREKAQEKLFSDLGRYRRLKRENADLIIAVGGCVASQEGVEILKRAPFVNIIFGPQTLHRLPIMYKEFLATGKPVIDISFPEIEKFDHLPLAKIEESTADISIMEGCNNFCSYCIVPYVRGKEISRPVTDILQEINHLSAQGVQEISLLGQNVNNYLGRSTDNTIYDLADLIRLIAEIENIKRIRFVTSHPKSFSLKQIQMFSDVTKLVNHLHLPVQSGSDKILTRMCRGYTICEYKDKIARLKSIRPDISVSSDFIVAFPGETDADFNDTLQLVSDIVFDTSFSFIYSARPGTPAAKLRDDIPLEVKKERLQVLQKLLNINSKKISNAMVGKIEKVLLTGKAKKNDKQLTGRTENNRVVNCIAPESLINKFVDIKITKVLPNSLLGELV